MKLAEYVNKSAHVLAGILAGLAWYSNPFLSGFIFLLFFVYEFVEQTQVKDEMYHELKEFSIGFLVLVSPLVVSKVLPFVSALPY